MHNLHSGKYGTHKYMLAVHAKSLISDSIGKRETWSESEAERGVSSKMDLARSCTAVFHNYAVDLDMCRACREVAKTIRSSFETHGYKA